MLVSRSETIAREFLTCFRTGTFLPKSGARRLFDQGAELGHLTLGLRIRRLGVRIPSGAQHHKALTCANAGQAPFKIRPLWTWGAPRVLVCFGIVCAGARCGVLPRAAPSGS